MDFLKKEIIENCYKNKLPIFYAYSTIRKIEGSVNNTSVPVPFYASRTIVSPSNRPISKLIRNE